MTQYDETLQQVAANPMMQQAAAKIDLAQPLQVPSEVERTNYLIEELSGAVGALQARLMPVLFYKDEIGPDGPMSPESAKAPLAGDIAAQNDRLYSIIESVRQTLSALEV